MSIKNKMESILLLGGDEVKIADLAKFFKLPENEIIDLLRDLKFERRHTGINLEINGDVTYLISNPQYGETVNAYFEHEYKPRKLTVAALETLSIIAYRQPITKREIEAIRGRAVDGVVFSLEERKFIRVCGRKNGPGRPKLYEITDKFLGYIGVNSIEELPNYKDVITGNIYEKFKDLPPTSDDDRPDDETEEVLGNVESKDIEIEREKQEEIISKPLKEEKNDKIYDEEEEEYGTSNDSEG
ncbi:segregation and condensation protein B [Fusobacterium sp. PH5-44]